MNPPSIRSDGVEVYLARVGEKDNIGVQRDTCYHVLKLRGQKWNTDFHIALTVIFNM